MDSSKRQRNTPQRQVILEELRKVESHPTAVEVYALVRRSLPRISLGTIYRNLDRLAAAGQIRKLALSGSEARFDGRLDPHDHVRCVACGCVADVNGLADDVALRGLTEAGGYEVLGYRLEFEGICPKCKAEAAAKAGGGQADAGE